MKRLLLSLSFQRVSNENMISDGSEFPWRAKMRSPSLVNLQILPELLRGHKISDVIAIIGSIDIMLGCVDR